MFKRVHREWGYWIELCRFKRFCIKILCFKDRAHISMQRHTFRNEIWFCFDGTGMMHPGEVEFGMFDSKLIRKNEWHQFRSWTASTILEIQYGSDVREDDIERV